MKRTYFIQTLFIALFASLIPQLHAQITLTKADIERIYAIGTRMNFAEMGTDTSGSIQIGKPDTIEQSFDFSNLNFNNLTGIEEMVVPQATAYDSLYPSAEYCDVLSDLQNTPTSFKYYVIDDSSFTETGEYNGDVIPSSDPHGRHYTPFKPLFEFPFTLGKQWTYASGPDTETGSGSSDVYFDTVQTSCDAYGKLRLLINYNIQTYDCLRTTTVEVMHMNYSNISAISNSHTVDYYTKEGFHLHLSTYSIPPASDVIKLFYPVVTTVKGTDIPSRGDLSLTVYPSPIVTSNDHFTLSYNLQHSSSVAITLLNAIGQITRKLDCGMQNVGTHTASLSALDLPSGVYVCMLTANGIATTRPITVVR